jgi:hypothetical protein
VVTITLPVNGHTGPVADLVATVTDDTAPAPDVTWILNGMVVATGTPRFGVDLSAGCAPGPDTLVATATDSEGATGSDTVTIDC